MTGWWIGGGAGLGVMLWGFWRIGRGARLTVEQARRQLQQQREHLEAEFFTAAAASGKPRGLRWKDCEWGEQLEFALDRQSGLWTAFVGVTISFEAIEGGDMEGLPAVSNLRNASAVFVHDNRRWVATGRAVFNLNPNEVLSRFSIQFAPVEQPGAGRT